MTYNTFQEAFISEINALYFDPQFVCTDRLGKTMHETLSISYTVTNPSTFKFNDESLGRITYEYANDFYTWLISNHDLGISLMSEKYPHVSGFLSKPSSPNLPDNFNALYGPRIQEQLPEIIKELTTNENSRRAVISILQPQDLLLLTAEEDSNLEFPCCDSFTISIRNNKMYGHLHMRSNNMGNVVKLDMYLWGRFMCELSESLNCELGEFHTSIASAHIFTNDFEYFTSKNIID